MIEYFQKDINTYLHTFKKTHTSLQFPRLKKFFYSCGTKTTEKFFSSLKLLKTKLLKTFSSFETTENQSRFSHNFATKIANL